MWPFLVWSGIMFLCVHNVSHYYDYILYPQNSYWFLWGLFFIVCIFNIVDLIADSAKLKQERIVGAVTIVLIGIQLVLPDAKFLGYEYISYYFLYYVLGYYLRKYSLLVPEQIWLLVGLAIVCLVLGLFWKPLPEVSVLVNWIHFIPGSLLNIGYRIVTAFLFVLSLLSRLEIVGAEKARI